MIINHILINNNSSCKELCSCLCDIRCYRNIYSWYKQSIVNLLSILLEQLQCNMVIATEFSIYSFNHIIYASPTLGVALKSFINLDSKLCCHKFWRNQTNTFFLLLPWVTNVKGNLPKQMAIDHTYSLTIIFCVKHVQQYGLHPQLKRYGYILFTQTTN